MKHEHTTNTINYTAHCARVVVPLVLLTALFFSAAPGTALADRVVIINQPDDYIVLNPIAERRHARRVVVEAPAPSWVVVGNAPPPVRVEVRPPRPFAGAVWVGGYWWWSGARYVWIGGHYVRPIAGYRFVAPRWVFSGGYYYHVRGHYRPHGVTVRHRSYRDYRQVGYYGHRYPRGYRHAPPRSYPHRGRSEGYQRDYDERRGHGAHGKGHGRQHRAAPARPRPNASRHARATPRRTAPTPRASAGQRPGRSSRVAPVSRGQSSRSARVPARGNSHRGRGAPRAGR